MRREYLATLLLCGLLLGACGSFYDDIIAQGSSSIAMSGGSIGGTLCASDTSSVQVSGGSPPEGLVAEDSGNVTISGGSIQYTLSAYHNSNITIFGTDFNYGYGTIGDLSATVTGTLASGEIVNVPFSRHATASFSLAEYVIPAPGAIVLGSIGVGLVGHLRKRRAL